jgi:hypothetical protein
MGLAHHYPYDARANCYVGAGCHECGYRGKRRLEAFFPLKPVDGTAREFEVDVRALS